MGVFSALLRRIAEFIEVFKRKEDIFRIVGDASPIGIYKALKILRELKQKKEKEYVVVLAKPSHFTIAHEIAHAILKHRAFWESNIKQEDEADKLAESWGFKKREN